MHSWWWTFAGRPGGRPGGDPGGGPCGVHASGPWGVHASGPLYEVKGDLVTTNTVDILLFN